MDNDRTTYTKADLDREARLVVQAERARVRLIWGSVTARGVKLAGWRLIVSNHTCPTLAVLIHTVGSTIQRKVAI